MSARSRPSRALSLLAAALSLSCHDGAGPELASHVAIVAGTVTDALGGAVPGARVESSAFLAECLVGPPIGSGSPTVAVTDGGGHYRQQVVSGSPRPRQCVQVRVTLPNATTPAATRTSSDVQFEPRGEASLPYPVTQIDVRLP